MFNFFKKHKLDSITLAQIEDELIQADLGMALTTLIIKALSKISAKNCSLAELKDIVAKLLKQEMLKYYKKDSILVNDKPYVILISGTNGSGKTTSIAKLAKYMKDNNFKVLLSPCDTFRAGATQQLEIWAQRIKVDSFNDKVKDPAALAYKSLDYAKSNHYDVVLIDTSGRLTTNTSLMDELKKIERTITKIIPNAPHESLLILDATLGQNTLIQAQNFAKNIHISGIIMTKLDSDSKGGILLNVIKSLQVPVYFIGIGEQESDLQAFNLDNHIKKILS